MKNETGHVVLLGDSIFDNRSYTGGEPAVIEHLRSMLPATWRATLRAIDGASTADVSRQFPGIPDDATHLALSVGGNDALMNSDLLATHVPSTTAALLLFGDRLDRFEAAYRDTLTALSEPALPVTVCTIYNGALPPAEAGPARIALMMFNDVICRAALDHRASVIELRRVCTEPADYANPIEPSGSGGRKIAEAIARAVGAIPGGPASRVFVGSSNQVRGSGA